MTQLIKGYYIALKTDKLWDNKHWNMLMIKYWIKKWDAKFSI